MDFHLMWAKSALRFIVYEPNHDNAAATGLHLQSENTYVMVLQLTHASNADIQYDRDDLETSATNSPLQGQADGARPSPLRSNSLTAPQQQAFTFPAAEVEEGGGDDDDMSEMTMETATTQPLDLAAPFTSALNLTLKPPYLVPAWVEVIDRLSVKCKRNLVYVFVLQDRCILRSHTYFRGLFGFLSPNSPKAGINPRFSERNIRRIRLGETFRQALARAGDPQVDRALKVGV
jgi:hypothetical protein